MPTVGDEEFAYTPEGEAAAEDFAEATGQDVISSYDAGGRVERIQGYGDEVAEVNTPAIGEIKVGQGYKDGGKVPKDTPLIKSRRDRKKDVAKARKKFYKQDLTKRSFRLMKEFKKLGKTKSTRRGIDDYKDEVKTYRPSNEPVKTYRPPVKKKK